MNENSSRNISMGTHWVGTDVAKSTFDAALVRCDQHYPDTPLREIPACTFERSSKGVQAFLSWLDAQGLDDHGRACRDGSHGELFHRAGRVDALTTSNAPPGHRQSTPHLRLHQKHGPAQQDRPARGPRTGLLRRRTPPTGLRSP